MRKSSKIFTIALAVAMVMSSVASAGAVNIEASGDGAPVPVELSTEAMTFSVTVPTSLPVNVAADGAVTTAKNAKIVNNSAGAVRVTNVEVEAQNGWTLVVSTDLSTKQVNTKAFYLTVDDSIHDDPIPANGELGFEYNAYIAPQATTLTATIANVVFTVGWDEVGPLVVEIWDMSKDSDSSVVATLYDNGTMIISGEGEMVSCAIYNQPYRNAENNIKALIIEKDVKNISADAFHSYNFLNSVTISKGVTSIDGGAFYGCSSLESVEIPDGVTKIGGSAFYGCSSLVSIEIPDSVTVIGSDAFAGCTALTSITYNGTTYNTIESFKTAFTANGNTMA